MDVIFDNLEHLKIILSNRVHILETSVHSVEYSHPGSRPYRVILKYLRFSYNAKQSHTQSKIPFLFG